MTTYTTPSSTVNISATTNITSSPYISAMGYASPGSYIVANGTGASAWGNISISNDLNGDQLSVKGDASFEGDIKIQGVSLKETLENIEKRLAILHPNPELEEKWENLRGLRQAYMELEAEIIEKEKMWAILKR